MHKIIRKNIYIPRASFSSRLSSTRTGSEPCKKVMTSSTSEPTRVKTAGFGFGFLDLKETDDVSVFSDSLLLVLRLLLSINDVVLCLGSVWSERVFCEKCDY